MAKKIVITDYKDWEIECQTDGYSVLLTAANLEDPNIHFATATLDVQTITELIDTLTELKEKLQQSPR